MSMLEAAFAGPLYTENEYENARQRFQSKTLATANQMSRDRGSYLIALETEKKKMMIAAIAEMLWELPGSGTDLTF